MCFQGNAGFQNGEKGFWKISQLRRTAGFCISVLCLLWRSTIELPMYLLLYHSSLLQQQMVANCYSGFNSAAGFDYKQESDTDSPTIWTASYVQSISGHNCITHLLTSICAWKCGTCAEIVSAWGKLPQSSSLQQTLPFFNSCQETSSWPNLLTVGFVRSHVWVREGGNSHCFISGL